ncbi:MAG: hypothetical protein ACP5I4_14320 [Oceanipulchritudo sp.]
MKVLKRRFLLLIVFPLVVAGGFVLLIPWWLPAAAGPVARAYGIEWRHTGRLGWTHLTCRRCTSPLTEPKLERLEILDPEGRERFTLTDLGMEDTLSR